MVEYDQASHTLMRFDYEGKPIEDDRLFSVGLQQYFYDNLEYAFDLTLEELAKNRPGRTAGTSCIDVAEEVLLTGEYRDAVGEGRFILHLI